MILIKIELAGSILRQEEKPTIIKYRLTERDLYPNKKYRGKDGLKIVRKGVNKIYFKKPVSAYANVKWNKETINYFLRTAPNGQTIHKWSKLPFNKKIEAHIETLIHDMGGLSYSYQIVKE